MGLPASILPFKPYCKHLWLLSEQEDNIQVRRTMVQFCYLYCTYDCSYLVLNMVPGLARRHYGKDSLGLASASCKNNRRLGSRLHPNGCSLPDGKVCSPQGKEGRQGIIYIHKAKEIGKMSISFLYAVL